MAVLWCRRWLPVQQLVSRRHHRRVSLARHLQRHATRTSPGGSTLSDVYQGGYTSWVGLVNAYADLGTWWCLTPFVGVGIGAAYIQTTGLQDSGLSFAPGVARSARFVLRQRRHVDQLRMGRPCRCRLQGHQQLFGRTRVPLSRHRATAVHGFGNRSTAAMPVTSSLHSSTTWFRRTSSSACAGPAATDPPRLRRR